MTPRELLELLGQVPAARPPGVDILIRFEETTILTATGKDLADLLEQQENIHRAIYQLDRYAQEVKKLVNRCCAIYPKPGSSPPLGF